MDFGVKARMMMARSFEWRGGSMKTSQSGVLPEGVCASELKDSWSWRARFTLS
ncbi:hypothetical protein [Pyxidicoccus parkwayensis]|uniref:hypothetical protein n=1 Tax=Pyxidicoccus parkwayensis TaxID=2813578 RepID=UPI0035306966